MYSIGHIQFKLDGIITEFADIYAPLAQIWKTPAPAAPEESAKKGSKTNHMTSEENWCVWSLIGGFMLEGRITGNCWSWIRSGCGRALCFWWSHLASVRSLVQVAGCFSYSVWSLLRFCCTPPGGLLSRRWLLLTCPKGIWQWSPVVLAFLPILPALICSS